MAYTSGIEKIKAGKRPLGMTSTMACIFCMNGHMLECHHPLTCDEAKCSHCQPDEGIDYFESDEAP